MKKFLPLLLILLLSSCYTTQVYKFEPYNSQNLIYEQGKKIAYQDNDSVIVSVAFNSYKDGVYSLETTIDNQTSHPVIFDPKNVYLIRYNTDSSMADGAIHYAINPQKDIDSINKKITSQQNKLAGNTVFSIFLGMAYIAASVASINNEELAESMDAIAATHEVAQITLDAARSANIAKMDELAYEKDNVLNSSLQEITIEPGGFTGGNLRFYVPYSAYYKIYLTANNRIYRFTFQGIQQNL